MQMGQESTVFLGAGHSNASSDMPPHVHEYYEHVENEFEYEIEEVIRCVRAGRTESEVMPWKDTLRCAEMFETALHV